MKNSLYKNYAIVYGLVDPETNQVRYVGKSLTGIHRAYDHWTPSSIKEGNTPKNNWIKRLKNKGTKYKVSILFAIEHSKFNNKQDLNEFIYNKEHEIMNEYTGLLNLCDGGVGSPGRKVSEQTREKMIAAGKKRDLSYLAEYSKRTEAEKAFTKQRRIEKLKQRKRAIPGAEFNYKKLRGERIIAKNCSGEEIIGFYTKRDAAKVVGGKCSHTGISRAIKQKSIYYGYYWENA